jgi:hypothetical protein
MHHPRTAVCQRSKRGLVDTREMNVHERVAGAIDEQAAKPLRRHA